MLKFSLKVSQFHKCIFCQLHMVNNTILLNNNLVSYVRMFLSAYREKHASY